MSAADGRSDERDVEFVGFLTFLDRPKEGSREAIEDLARLGVSVKLITGDSGLVARHVAALVGLGTDSVLTDMRSTSCTTTRSGEPPSRPSSSSRSIPTRRSCRSCRCSRDRSS
jgi:magnesium-transporting ATPase (P-type)